MSHLVVDAQRELLVGIGHIGGIAEAVNRQTACELLDTEDRIPQPDQEVHTDRWQENFDVATSYKLVFCQNSPNVVLQCRRRSALTSG